MKTLFKTTLIIFALVSAYCIGMVQGRENKHETILLDEFKEDSINYVGEPVLESNINY